MVMHAWIDFLETRKKTFALELSDEQQEYVSSMEELATAADRDKATGGTEHAALQAALRASSDAKALPAELQKVLHAAPSR